MWEVHTWLRGEKPVRCFDASRATYSGGWELGERSGYSVEMKGFEVMWRDGNLLVSARQQPGRKERIKPRHEQVKNL